MDLAQSFGLGGDKARQSDRLAVENVAHEGYVQPQSKREERGPEEQCIPHAETATGGAARAVDDCNTTLHDNRSSYRHSRSTAKTNLLNGDMLGQYEHGKGALRCTTQVDPNSNLALKERNASLTDECERLKHKYANLKKHCQDLQAKVDDIDDERVRLRSHKRDSEQRYEGLYTFCSELDKRLFRPCPRATGTECHYYSLADDILQVALEGRTASHSENAYSPE